jgi:hypothetical protein
MSVNEVADATNANAERVFTGIVEKSFEVEQLFII